MLPVSAYGVPVFTTVQFEQVIPAVAGISVDRIPTLPDFGKLARDGIGLDSAEWI